MKEAVRIREYIPKAPQKEKVEMCADCKNPIEAYGTKTAQELVKYSQDTFKRKLCAKCTIAETNKLKTVKENNAKTENDNTEDAKKTEKAEDTAS
jgi:hypothetical protein